MKNIKENTVKARTLNANYENATATTLEECYSNYSVFKARAYNRCLELMESLNGWGARICSWNAQAFTFAFQFVDKETGVIRLAYITKDYDYVTDLAQTF